MFPFFFLNERNSEIGYSMFQPIVTIPVGDHVNVLHDYKKTGQYKTMKHLNCRCYHLIDKLVEFSQNVLLLTHLKCHTRQCCACINSHTCLVEKKNCQKSFRILKSSRHPLLHCQYVLSPNLSMCLLKYYHVR